MHSHFQCWGCESFDQSMLMQPWKLGLAVIPHHHDYGHLAALCCHGNTVPHPLMFFFHPFFIFQSISLDIFVSSIT